jgi:hypothetical protein
VDRLIQAGQLGSGVGGGGAGLMDSPSAPTGFVAPDFGPNGLAPAGAASRNAHGTATASLPWSDPGTAAQSQTALSSLGLTGPSDGSTQLNFSTSLTKVLQYGSDEDQRKAQLGLAGDGTDGLTLAKPKASISGSRATMPPSTAERATADKRGSFISEPTMCSAPACCSASCRNSIACT